MRSLMRVPRSLVLLALVCACAQHAAGQTESAQAAAWARYTYPGDEFSVELPGAPAVFHTSRIIRSRPYDSDTMRVFGVYHGGVVYMVVSYDRPRAAEPDERFAGYVSDVRGLKPTGEVRLGGAKGWGYEVGLMNFKGKARVFRTQRHAYFLKAFSDAEGHGEAVERFLNSFALGAEPAGISIPDDPPVQPYVTSKDAPAPSAGGVGPGPGRGSNAGVTAAAQGVSEETLKLARGRGGAAAGDGPYKQNELSRKAVLVYKPEPDYTEEARKGNVTGVVRLRAVLSASGKLTNITVVKTLPRGLTDEAVRAARHILFFPAIKDGRPVSQWVTLEYHFNIY